MPNRSGSSRFSGLRSTSQSPTTPSHGPTTPLPRGRTDPSTSWSFGSTLQSTQRPGIARAHTTGDPIRRSTIYNSLTRQRYRPSSQFESATDETEDSVRTASGNEDSWAALVARTTAGRSESRSRRPASHSTNLTNKSDDRRVLSEDLELGRSPERSSSPLPFLDENATQDDQDSTRSGTNNDSLSSADLDESYPPPPRRYLSPLQKNIIKCVAAYFLAELFTFLPFLSDLLGSPFDLNGPVRNVHVVATVATYFNPAKTNGAMVEADLFMLMGLLYALYVLRHSSSTLVLTRAVQIHLLWIDVDEYLVGETGISSERAFPRPRTLARRWTRHRRMVQGQTQQA